MAMGLPKSSMQRWLMRQWELGNTPVMASNSTIQSKGRVWKDLVSRLDLSTVVAKSCPCSQGTRSCVQFA